jgi:protein-cysteine N-palmitoyltransferase HHAT
VGAVVNILMMMGANLVGFVVGVDGARYLFTQLVNTFEGISFFFLPPLRDEAHLIIFLA